MTSIDQIAELLPHDLRTCRYFEEPSRAGMLLHQAADHIELIQARLIAAEGKLAAIEAAWREYAAASIDDEGAPELAAMGTAILTASADGTGR